MRSFLILMVLLLGLQAACFASSPEKHPKDRAIEYFQSLIASKSNTQVNRVIADYARNLLTQASNEYTASFLGGDDLQWTYLVSVDFQYQHNFRSLVTVITVPKNSSEKPALKKVFSSSEIHELVGSKLLSPSSQKKIK